MDMNQIPPPPGVKESVEGFVEEDAGNKGGAGLTGDRDEQYKKLEQDMIQQIRVCLLLHIPKNTMHSSKMWGESWSALCVSSVFSTFMTKL